MSFLWGKSKSDTDVSRARQIADLKASFPSIKQPNNDDSSFELSFELDRQYNTLRIWLPSDFPSNKPVLQVVGSGILACCTCRTNLTHNYMFIMC